MRALAVLFALLAVSSTFAQAQNTVGTPLNGTLADLDDWFNGLWGFFNLTQTEAIACFTTEIQANTYFQMMGYLYQLSGDYSQGNRIATIADNTQYQYLALTINQSLACYANTTDHQKLLAAAGFDSLNNQTLLEQLQALYFIAHILDWNLAFAPIYADLAALTYNTAGYAMGPVLQVQAANSSQYIAYHLGLQAWDNQVFFFFNLTTPEQLPNCYNEKNAHDWFDFMWEWTSIVYNSTAANVVNNTQAFFQGDGAYYYQKLEPVFYCEGMTNDQDRLNTALGVDIHSQEFIQAMQEFVVSETTTYMQLFIQIHGAFVENTVVIGASSWAQFLNDVAKTISL